jgi:hypothetical protein
LQQAALTAAGRLNSFINLTDKQLQQFSNLGTTSEDERKKASEKSSQFMEEQIVVYNKQFRGIAVHLRREMLSRLKFDEQESSTGVLFDFPTNPLGMRQVANTLEKLADNLCSVQQKRSKSIGELPILTN